LYRAVIVFRPAEVEVTKQEPVPVNDSNGTVQVAEPSETVTVPVAVPEPGRMAETLTATRYD
jgi:hypothetical protein